MQGSNVFFFVLAATVSFSATLPRESRANDQRMDASACFSRSECPNCANAGYAPVTEADGLQNASNGLFVELECPVPDRWDFLPETFRTINVHGYCNASSDGCFAFANTTFYGSNTGGRYSKLQAATQGNYIYNFGGFYTSGDRGDFKYIDVFLGPPDSTGSEATLRGFWFST